MTATHTFDICSALDPFGSNASEGDRGELVIRWSLVPFHAGPSALGSVTC